MPADKLIRLFGAGMVITSLALLSTAIAEISIEYPTKLATTEGGEKISLPEPAPLPSPLAESDLLRPELNYVLASPTSLDACSTQACIANGCNCNSCNPCLNVCIDFGYGHEARKARRQYRCWGYPEYFCERPFGSINSQVTRMMVHNGLRDRMVLYEYDFGVGDEASALRERGEYQLEKIVKRMQMVFHPIVIEPSGDLTLDQERQNHVLNKLAELGIDPENCLVVVGRPNVRGLDGIEALPIYENLREQTRLRGNVGIDTSGLRDIGYGSSANGSAGGQESLSGQQ